MKKLADTPASLVLLAGGGTAGLLAVANVVWLRETAGVGRLRDLQLLHLSRRLAEAFEGNLLEVLPVWVNAPFDLSAPTGLLAFVGASAALHLVLLGVAAAVAAAVVALVARARPPGGGRVREWAWDRAYPAAVLAMLAAPFVLSLVHRLGNAGGDPRASVAVAAVLVPLLWAALTTSAGAPLRSARAFRAFGLAGIGLALVAVATGGAAAILASGAGAARPAPAPGLPNVLLVSIDSLRPDHLGCYGYARDTSPALDRLAAEGARFETVVSSSSWTLPAHVTMLSALGAEEHGVVDDDLRMHPSIRTLPEVLWHAGYTTGGIVSGSFLDALYGFARGFDHYDDYSIVKAHEPASFKGITSPKLFELASAWLGAWDAGGRTRPFFLFLHLWDVHYDYTPPPPWDRYFDPDYTGTVTGEDFEVGTQVRRDMPARDLEHVIALYDGEIRFTDEYVARLRAELERLGALDDTIVVVTADHGEEFFEHGEKGHAKQLYEETILVPLVIRWPAAVHPGRVVGTPVRLADLAPTILSLTGVPAPAWFGSTSLDATRAARDLRPLLGGDAAPADGPPALADLRGRMRALRTADWKLITHQSDRRELYDLAADPAELHDVSASRSEVVTALAEEAGRWGSGHRSAPPRVELSREHVDRLRALGYVE